MSVVFTLNIIMTKFILVLIFIIIFPCIYTASDEENHPLCSLIPEQLEFYEDCMKSYMTEEDQEIQYHFHQCLNVPSLAALIVKFCTQSQKEFEEQRPLFEKCHDKFPLNLDYVPENAFDVCLERAKSLDISDTQQVVIG